MSQLSVIGVQDMGIYKIAVQVILAWQTILQPSSASSMRKSAEEYLLQLKRESPIPSQQVALQLLDHSIVQTLSQLTPNAGINMPLDDICLFGLHMLDDLMQMHWNMWHISEQVVFRDNFLKMVQQRYQYSYTSTGQPRVIQEKIAKLIVGIALRTWPEQWPDFLPIHAQSSGSFLTTILPAFSLELTLDIERILAEEIFIQCSISNKMEDQRKAELKSVLLKCCPFLVEQWRDIMHMPGFAASESLAASLFRLLCIYVEWMPVGCFALEDGKSLLFEEQYFYAYVSTIPITRLVSCLSSQCPLWSYLDVLYALIHRQFMASASSSMRTDDAVIMIFEPFLKSSSLAWFHQVLLQMETPATMEALKTSGSSMYEIVKRIAQILCAFGEKQLWNKKGGTSIVQKIQGGPKKLVFTFIECMLVLTCQSNSELCFSMTLPFWSCALKCDLWIDTLLPGWNLLPQLVQQITKRYYHYTMYTLGSGSSLSEDSWHKDGTPMEMYCRSCDFDAFLEYEQWAMHVRARLNDIIKALSKKKPLEMVQLAQSGFGSMPPYTMQRNSTPYAQQLHINTTFLHVVLSSISISSNSDATCNGSDATRIMLIEILNNLLRSFIEFNHPDALCLVRILEGIEDVCMALKEKMNAFLPVLNRIVQLVSFTTTLAPEIDNEEQAEHTANVRRKAANILVRLALCPVFIKQILPYCRDLITQLGQHTTIVPLLHSESEFGPKSSSRVGLTERASIIEFFMILTSEKDHPQLKEMLSMCLQCICVPILSEWQSDLLVRNLSSFDGFMNMFGLAGLAHSGASQDQFGGRYQEKQKTMDRLQHVRSWMHYLCHATHIIIRRLETPIQSTNTSQVWQAIFQTVVPCCMRIVQYIHQLWNTMSWNEYGGLSVAKLIISMTEEEKRNLLGLGGFDKHIEDYKTSTDRMAVQIRIWLGNMRLTLYSLFGDLFSLGESFYLKTLQHTDPNLLPWGYLFTDIMHIQSRHMKHFIQVILFPLLRSCPESLYETIFLQPWFGSFFAFMMHRLDNAWQRQIVVIKTETSTEDDDGDDNQGLSDEMVQEKTLRSETHAFACLMHDMLVPITERGMILGKTCTLEHASPLIKFILSNNSLAEAVLQSVLHCFTWRDSSSCDKAIQISQRLVLLLGGRAEYMTFLARTMVTAVMQALSDGYHQELHDHLLALLCLVYQYNALEMEDVFKSIPSIGQHVSFGSDLKTLREAFEQEKDKENSKRKRVAMRQLVSPIIGVKMSCLFKEENNRHVIKASNSEWMLSLRAGRKGSNYGIDDSIESEAPLGLSDLLYHEE